jgi:hypothetical protein
MTYANIYRWALAATMTIAAMTSAGVSAQTTAEQQKKLAAEALQKPSGLTSTEIDMQQDKKQAESIMAELQQSETSSEARLQAKKEKERAEMLLTIDSSNQLIKDKPYAASAVTKTTQVLADGNHIVHQWENKTYRDASGRTRREQTLGALQASTEKPAEVHILIYDPVANADFILDPASKTARKLVHKRIQVHVIPNDQERFGQVAQMPPLDESKDIATEDLGTRTIEGLQCTGKRTTFTIPAGLQGNERPIVITLENWYSKDIEAMVESITNDPRSGQSHYKLQNVQLGDQPVSLFEPSADYKIEPAARTITIN